MSKPGDIPDDVLQAALDATDSPFPSDIARIARAIMAAKTEEREAIIQECEAQKQAFLSPEYASPQPVGSICERFAIDECIRAIRKRGD